MNIAGIILCGGESTRMGMAKALLPVGDELMLGRVVRLLSEVVDPIVIVAARKQQLPPLPEELTIVRDTQPAQGPLRGLRDGLAALPDDVDAAYVSGCDVPLLKPAFVAHLIARLGEYEIVAPLEGEHHHPLGAAYRVSVLPKIDKLLASGERKLQRLLACCETRSIDTADLRAVDADLSSLVNCNGPESYAAALRQLGLDEPSSPRGNSLSCNRSASRE